MRFIIILFMAIEILFFATYLNADINSGLVAYYPLDGNVNDESGNHLDAIEYSGSFTDNCIINKGIYLDGIDDGIHLPDGWESHPLHGSFSQRSVSMWFKCNSTYPRQMLYDEGGDEDGLNIYVYNYKLYTGAWGKDKNYDGNWLNTDVDTNWHHVCVTFEKDKAFKLYLDGRVNAQVGVERGVGLHQKETGIGYLIGDTIYENGNYPSDEDHHFAGFIDEVRIYDRAISYSEIQYLYHQKVDKYVPTTIYNLLLNDEN